MTCKRRFGFSAFQLIVVVAMLAVAFSLFFPAVMKVRMAANRAKRSSNMRQIGIAVNNHDAQVQYLPPGCDENNFSAMTRLLPYFEEDTVATKIDFDKPVDDKVNLAVAKNRIMILQSPSDPLKQVTDDFPGANVLFCAGSEPGIDGNNNVFCRGKKTAKYTLATIPDGTSNTMMAVETLKGDGSEKATDVRRQHVRLDKDALKDLKDDAGEKDWKDGKHISGMRCANWMDGRFMQGTFTATRPPNTELPDVDCGGEGGLMSVRSLDGIITIGLFDGHVVNVDATKIDLKIWKRYANAASNEEKNFDLGK